MRKTLAIVFILVFTASIRSQAPYFQWAKSFSGSQNEIVQAVTTDTNGNVYTVGYYAGIVDFDPGPATFTLGSTAVNTTFISKLDAFGNFIWAKCLGDTLLSVLSMKSDNAGNIYLAGRFQNPIDFDPGPATYSLSSNGNTDVFILKLDMNGNFVWVKQTGGTGFDDMNYLEIDNSGNIYTTGRFSDTVDFDPGPATFTLAATSSTTNIFIRKMNAAGNFVWAKNFIGGGVGSPSAISIDNSGAVYVSGNFYSVADFDPSPATYTLSSAGSSDGFICKLDGSGNFIWAKSFGGSNTEAINSMAIDNAGSVYLTGYFMSTGADFDPGPATFTLSAMFGGIDIYILKLTPLGNFGWVKPMSGVGAESATKMVYDNAGSIYLTGHYSSQVDFDPGPATSNLTTFGFYDIFISKLDTAGNYIWAKGMGGTLSETSTDLTIDTYGNIFTVGIFQSAALDFDYGSPSYTISAVGQYDVFIQKLNNCLAPSNAINTTPVSFQSFCINATTTLSALSTGTVNWYASSTSTISLGSGAIFITPTLSPGTYTYYAEAQNCNFVSTRIAITVTVELCTGLQNIVMEEEPSLNLFPNPSNGILNIKINDPNKLQDSETYLRLINALGQIVLQQDIDLKTIRSYSDQTFTINIEKVPNGLYFLEFTNGANTKTVKVIKERD